MTTADPYLDVWTALSVTARAELTSLAAGRQGVPPSDELRAELLERMPDVIEWRAWRPGPSSGHQLRVDERLLDWIKAQAHDVGSNRNCRDTPGTDAPRDKGDCAYLR